MRALTAAGWSALLLASVAVMTEVDVHAYIDPGSGSLFVQTLLAGLIAAGVLLRRLIKRLKFWNRPAPGRKSAPTGRR